MGGHKGGPYIFCNNPKKTMKNNSMLKCISFENRDYL